MIAIDPGASGGIAVHIPNLVLDCAHTMPETEGDMIDFITDQKLSHNLERAPLLAVVEEVGGFAGTGQPGSAMFKFGRNFGFLLGALQMAGWRVELIRPQAWQKRLGLGTKSGMSKTEWKNKLKAEAQRRFPHIKVTLAIADALLILEAARMK